MLPSSQDFLPHPNCIFAQTPPTKQARKITTRNLNSANDCSDQKSRMSASDGGSALFEPSEEEKKFYYFGLIGPPRLVARTGCGHWPGIQEDDGYRSWPEKHLSTIGRHEILLKWTAGLESSITETLRGCE